VRIALACAGLIALLAAPLRAQTGAAQGRVVDEDGAAVVGATVAPDTGGGVATDAGGAFRLDDLPLGERLLTVRAVGFVTDTVHVGIRPGEVARVTVRLRADVALLGEVVVTGDAARLPTSVTLRGDALRERLGGSVAATLAGVPGLWQRYNGPAAAQPVVRGLAGDRVLVLENGVRTGDVATTAADHAVTIDPIGAQRVDVIRGPAALLYGSVVLGGVVDVQTGELPQTLPTRASAFAQGQAEGAAPGASVAAGVTVPVGPVAFYAEASTRRAGDTRTPLGELPFTDLDARTMAASATLFAGLWRLAASGRDVRQTYGVPSGFDGVTLPGAHVGGIYVDLYRQSGRLVVTRDQIGSLERITLRGALSRFYQAEFERGGFVGTEFGQVLGSLDAQGFYGHDGRPRGAFGASLLNRDWAAAGSQTGTRPATSRTVSAFGYHEQPLGTTALGTLALQAGLRWDVHTLTPRDTTSSRIASGRRLTGIRARSFAEPSGALALVLTRTGGWTAGTSVARSVRMPAVEELYSNGPHLASFAYEVGNPALDAEVGWGVEAFVGINRPIGHAQLTLYRNAVAQYVRYAPLIGADGHPLRDYRLQRYDVYQATADDAVLQGVEAEADVRLGGAWQAGATLQGVWGWDTDTGEALPFVPPLHTRLTIRHDGRRLLGGLALDAAAAQGRVPTAPGALTGCVGREGAEGCPDALPGEFVPTDGRTLVSLWIGGRMEVRGSLHSLTLRVDNALDVAYRDPLSRVKTVAPQPGRNVSLLYRLDL
jgi:iron complex outermembrane receptor protein